MGSEWTEGTLGDVAKVQSGFAFKSGDMGETGHPVIKIKNINPPDVDVSDVQRVPASIIEANPRIEKFRLDKGDILIAMTGATVGKVGRMPAISEPHYLNQRVGKVFVTDENAADEDYVYYVLSQDGHVDQMLGLADGSAQPNISGTQIESLEVPLPPLPEQKAIAHILGTLDDKIELNRRMNATLEGMAQALFKSWFVDFDPVIDNALAAGNPIPDELAPRAEVRKKALANGTTQQGSADHPTLSDPKSLFPAAFEFTEELGWIPEGWEVVKLQNVCERIFSGGTPRTKEPDFWNGGIPWLSSGETGQRFILDTEKTITQAGVENSSTRQTRKGAVVIASAGQGKKRGQTSNLCFDSYINQSVIALEADNSVIPDSFLFFDLARRYEEFRQISDAHSSRGSLTTKLLAEIAVVVPTGQPLSDFGTIAGDAIRKITANARQTSELSKLRDTLLPKLIAGELPTSNS
jgi:type I restriction enzyme S subunit